MGHTVESVARERNIEISKIVDVNDDLERLELSHEDVVIDFTGKDALLKNLPILCGKKANIVSGSTGWLDKLDDVKRIVETSGACFLYATNFSIATHIFWKMAEFAAHRFGKIQNADVMIREVHHNKKTDSPSGTAITLAEHVMSGFKGKSEIVTDKLCCPPKAEELHVSSTRGGFVFGEHEVWFDTQSDSVKIQHVAKSRDAFAGGALDAATWLLGKKGFYSIDDYLENVIISDM